MLCFVGVNGIVRLAHMVAVVAWSCKLRDEFHQQAHGFASVVPQFDDFENRPGKSLADREEIRKHNCVCVMGSLTDYGSVG